VELEVADALVRGTTVHVMCPPDPGADLSVRVAIALTRSGYNGVPHIAARTVRSRHHLEELLGRMAEANVREAFFPGGDGDTTAGPYGSAVELLDDLATLEPRPQQIGVTSYPQGHRTIPDEVLLEALLHKQRVATFMVSETCLDPAVTVSWLRGLRASGVTLPLMVGVPGIVPLRRLLQALRAYGVNAAVGYLRKQHGMASSLLRRQFSPAPLLAGLLPWCADPELGIAALHFYTFNEIARTEAWRRRALEAGPRTPRRSAS
jgi:methylenetetrahydrofolate reductase (NADPH)